VHRVRAHSIELAVEEFGSGEPPILVVPQWFLSSRSMRSSALVRRLGEQHRMILYDRRGTGDSEKPGPPYTVARDSRDLAALTEALSLEGLVVLGMGVRGSLVALHFAGHFPQRVAAIVSLGGTPRWGAGPEWPYGISDDAWQRAFADLGNRTADDPPPGASLAMHEDWRACGPDAAMDILVRTRDEDLRPFLRKVTPPTLVIHLRGDEVVPFEAARWLADSLPNGTLELFDAPREIPFHAPEELATHIEEFLATVR
jgi:pimeloyl-ACP methyl ester carboxylesterase